jgi:tripartite-type tricarboxylate transporter receptor subunit TctC
MSTFGLAATMTLAPARAISEEAYFSGPTIELLSSYSDGSSGSTIMQEWGKAVERLHPDVRVIVRNNSGGTSALAAALLADAQPDGLTIGTADMDSIVAKATGSDIHDISQFAVVGSLSHGVDILFASPKSGIASVADLRDKTWIVAVRSSLSNDYFTSLFLNAYLDTRIKPVAGYSSGEGDLAFLSGEAQLAFESTARGAKHIADGTGIPILVLGPALADDPFANVQALNDLKGNEEFNWVLNLIDSHTYGRLLAAPPDTPPDRLEAIRDLFMEAAAEPTFVAAATPLTALTATRGNAIQELVQSLMSSASDFSGDVAKALECGRQRAEGGKGCGP